MRGKHAAAAATRRTATVEANALETYQRRVRDLTAELKDEREKRATETASLRQEIRALRARLSEGSAPEVEALSERLRREIEKRSAADRLARKTQKALDDRDKQIGAVLIRMGVIRSQHEYINLMLTAIKYAETGEIEPCELVDTQDEGRKRKYAARAAQVGNARKGIRNGAQIIEDARR